MGEEKHESSTPPAVEEGDSHSIIQVGDIIHVHATPEQEARVLRKIDWLSVSHGLQFPFQALTRWKHPSVDGILLHASIYRQSQSWILYPAWIDQRSGESALSSSKNITDSAETSRYRIFLDFIRVLFWLPWMELAQFLSSSKISSW